MKRPQAHTIDTAAQKLFGTLIPNEWVIRSQSPDYGIDFTIDHFENQKFTGLRVAIQLKGTKRVQINGNVTSYSLNTDNLAEYVDKERMPVFLVRLDVESREGYFVFLQQYALESLADAPWRQQTSVTISIPCSNRLSDAANFIEVARSADAYMRELHPGTVNAAISAEKKKIEKMDPRFSAAVEAGIHGLRITLLPKEPVNAMIQLHGNASDIEQKMEDLLGRGLPLQFLPGQLSVCGLPALGDVSSHSGILQLFRTMPGKVKFVRESSLNSPSAIVEIAGEFTGGTSEMRFSGWLGKSPLKLEFSLTADMSRTNSLQFSVDLERWANQPLRWLSHFDDLKSIFLPATNRFSADIHCQLEGNPIFVARPVDDDCRFTQQFGDLISALEKAREVVRKLDLSTTFDPRITEEDLEQADILYQLLAGDQLRRPIANKPFTFGIKDCDLNVAKKMVETSNHSSESFKLIGPQTFQFFGQSIKLQNIETIFTDVVLLPSSVLEAVNNGLSEFDLNLRGSDTSEILMKKLDP